MKERVFLRRDLLRLIGLGATSLALSACIPTVLAPASCEPNSDDPAIGWGPNVYQPVFYGYADYNPSVGAPTNLRVYYPSLDGSPQCAPFLAGPGRFPLVVLLHG